MKGRHRFRTQPSVWEKREKASAFAKGTWVAIGITLQKTEIEKTRERG